MNVFDFQASALDGAPIDLSRYRGKVVLIVNTATACKFTPQFAGLEAIYREFHERGVEVLGFPCNQFRGQEPRDEAGIGEFCERNYGVSFPMFAKIDVNGAARIRCSSTSSAKHRACSARRPSNGTSPSSWSGATARWSSDMGRRQSRKRSQAISRSCWRKPLLNKAFFISRKRCPAYQSK